MKSLRSFTCRATAVAIMTLVGAVGASAAGPLEPLPALKGDAALRHLQKAGLNDGLKAAFEPLLQEAELNDDAGAAGDNFGFWVSIDGNTAVVSAPFDDDLGTDTGSVYVFVRTG